MKINAGGDALQSKPLNEPKNGKQKRTKNE